MKHISKMDTEKDGSISVKFLFLDIDGVLNSMEYLNGHQDDWEEVEKCIDMSKFEKRVHHQKHDLYRDRVEMLDVLEPLGVKIVLSSTWRIIYYEEAVEIFKQWSKLRIVGKTTSKRLTPNYEVEKRCGRGRQIQAFMDDYTTAPKYGPIEAFSILDDDSDMGDLMKHLIKVDGRKGLQQEHVNKLVEVFT